MTRVLYFSVAMMMLLVSCSSPPTPAPLPTATLAPPPTATATATAIPPTATLEPSPTPDPLIFRDDFDGALGEGWHWMREKSKYWSLTENPGWLQIMARPGFLKNSTITNVLARDAPSGDFEIETRINFVPGGRWQTAGLVIFGAAEDWISIIRAFCDTSNCAGDGFYLDVNDHGNYIGNNFATSAPEAPVFYLRLRFERGKFTGMVSKDGAKWSTLGAHAVTISPLFVAIVAGQAEGTSPKPAQFDYFVMNKVP